MQADFSIKLDENTVV